MNSTREQVKSFEEGDIPTQPQRVGNSISNVIKEARENVKDAIGNMGQARGRMNSEKKYTNPDQLLAGISDIMLNSKLAVNYTNAKEKTDWSLLSKSILNKFAPGHEVLKQQVTQLKIAQEEEDKRKTECKKLKKQKKKPIKIPEKTPINMNGLQKMMIKKQQKRERLYSDNPEMLKAAELLDSHELSNMRMNMMISGFKAHKNTDFSRKRNGSFNRSRKYGRIKSKFRHHLSSLPRASNLSHQSSGLSANSGSFNNSTKSQPINGSPKGRRNIKMSKFCQPIQTNRNKHLFGPVKGGKGEIENKYFENIPQAENGYYTPKSNQARTNKIGSSKSKPHSSSVCKRKEGSAFPF